MNCCCGKKKPCACGCDNCKDINLNEVIYSIKCRLNAINENITKELCFGYKCDEQDKEDADELCTTLEALEEESRKQKLGAQSCMSCSEMRSWVEPIKAKVGTVVGGSKKNIKIDESGIEDWTLNHPQCTTLQQYKIYAKGLCRKLGIQCTVETKVCDLALEITKDIINCDLQMTINAYLEVCKLGLTLEKEIEQCELELTLLNEKAPSCDLTVDAYSELTNKCGLCFDMLHQIYKSGCQVRVDKDGCPILKTPFQEYNLKKDITGRFVNKSKLTIKSLIEEYK